jgi:FtsP/CotA-like multicopper oxidase with cupredoxin domain
MITSRHGVLEMRLNARAKPVTISGKKVNARVYSASAFGKDYPYAFMPPTIVLDPGDNLKVNLTNWLGEPTNLHTHGFFISPTGNQDNIFVDLTSSKSFLYNYFLPKDILPGSYWYHPHYHPLV